MEKEIIEKILNIDKNKNVIAEDGNVYHISKVNGIIYKQKGKFITKYFTDVYKIYENVLSTLNNNLFLSIYLNNFDWQSFVPHISETEFGARLYFIDKEIISLFNLSNRGHWYLLKSNKERAYDFKNKKRKNNIGMQINSLYLEREAKRKGESLRSELKTKNELGVTSRTYVASEGLKYSFGVELETSKGCVNLQDYFINKLNLSSLRDGSVEGSEYVTGILKGDSGFNQLYRTTTVLNRQNKVDKTCGMHVHIGGANFNKAFSVYAHILSEKIEESMFSIVAKTRRGNSYCGDVIKLGLEDIIKKYGASYGVEIAYEELFKAMTYGKKPTATYNKKNNHHYGRYCGKYNDIDDEDNFRYKWVNLIPCNFNVRNTPHPKHGYNKNADTIEFRFHSGTLNYTKIKNFTLICMAFVNYVENHEIDILSKKIITLEEIIQATYKRNVKPLLTYIDMRQKLFNNEPDLLESSDRQVLLKTKKEIICV